MIFQGRRLVSEICEQHVLSGTHLGLHSSSTAWTYVAHKVADAREGLAMLCKEVKESSSAAKVVDLPWAHLPVR